MLPAPPARLEVPGQQLDGAMEPVGVLDTGELQIPERPTTVGRRAPRHG